MNKYRFVDLRPHQTMPITEKSFNHLDHLISVAYIFAGITKASGYYAYSPPQSANSFPISMTRYEGPKGLRILTVGAKIGNFSVNSMFRNDAGTKLSPREIAGSLDVLKPPGTIIDTDESLSDLDINNLVDLIGVRLRNQTFGQAVVKKEFEKHFLLTREAA